MSRDMLDPELTKGNSPGSPEHYEAADLTGVEDAVRGLTEGFFSAAAMGPAVEEEGMINWICDTMARHYATQIPDDTDGQLLLDRIVMRLKREADTVADENYCSVYLSSIIQALYYAGKNGLILDISEMDTLDTLGYFHGSKDAPLSLRIRGEFKEFTMMDNCRISLEGKIDKITLCSQSSFYLSIDECPDSSKSMHDCMFYLSPLDKDAPDLDDGEVEKLFQYFSKNCTYHLPNRSGGWKRIYPKEVKP